MERLLNLPYTKWHFIFLLVAVGCSIAASSDLADQPHGTICGTVDIRGLSGFAKLDNCRVIEGNLSVGPVELLGTFQKSFPKLVEITESLVLLRVEGLRSLGQLFPNLVVIGGQSLLAEYSFVVYQLTDLEEIGLPNLTVIRNGAVRIEQNPRLCYIDTVDWGRITKGVSADENYFKGNNGNCVDICPSPCNLTEGVQRCWNAEHCQRMLSCPPECESGYCHGDVCCHSHCIGGCSGPLATQCISCNAVVHSTDTDDETCLQSCPSGLFMYKNRRCLTADECINFVDYNLPCKFRNKHICAKLFVMPYSESNKVPLCTESCPVGYQPDGDRPTKCVPCKNGQCPKVCLGKSIDSLDDAKDLKECTIIDGCLTLRIKHCVDEEKMEEYLGNITEVTGWLDISYSYGLHSLRMFRSLHKLGGQQLIEDTYVLRVYHNPNLQALFPEESLSGFEVVNGSVLFQHNGKLNYAKILEFLSKSGIDQSLDDEDVSVDTNGDKLTASIPELQLGLLKVSPHVAFIYWQSLTPVESNHFIGYSLHWKEVPYKSVTVFAKADACTDVGWSRQNVDCPLNSCNDRNINYVSGLTPWTRYAVYVRAFTLANDDTVSNVLYFRSAAGAPTIPLNIHVEAKKPGALQLTWDPPAHPNGNNTKYSITWRHIPIRQKEYSLRDFCTHPLHDNKDEKSVNTAGNHEHSEELLLYFQDILQTSFYIKRLENPQPARRRRDISVYAQESLHHRSSEHVVSEEQFTATNLDHYEVYSFEVRACNNLSDKYTLCGSGTIVSGRTSPDEMADAIPSVSLEGVTDGIRARWQDPPNPNGVILKYEIKYNATNMEQPEILCIPYHNASENQVTVFPLKPGDYKFWVRATSLAGLGPWTPYVEYHLKLFECYHWTEEDILSFGIVSNAAKQKARCENILGHVFTQGNNQNYPGCESCWCCKRKD